MQDVQLKTMDIQDIEPGMFIHSIAVQSGNMEVKSRGRVKSALIVKRMQDIGIRSVVVDLAQSEISKPTPEPEPELVKDYIPAEELPLKTTAKPHENMEEQPIEESVAGKKRLENIHMELMRAQQLVIQCSATLKRYVYEAKTGEYTDLSAAEDIVAQIEQSLERNPNALLSLSCLREHTPYHIQHAIRAAVLMVHFAKALSMSEKESQQMGLLGYLYDIGMSKIPKEITLSDSDLSPAQRQEIKTHPQVGAEILKSLKLEQSLLMAVEQHHERLTGNGYPLGISGELIHKYSRMLSIVDTYDALTSDRPHRSAISPIRAMKHLIQADSGFDLKLAQVFIRSMGLYPVGTLVKLTNNRIGLVIAQQEGEKTLPVVRVFYSLNGKHYLPPKDISLSSNNSLIKIDQPVLLRQHDLQLAPLFSHAK